MNINLIHHYGYSFTGSNSRNPVKKTDIDKVRKVKDNLKEDRFLKNRYSVNREEHQKKHQEMGQLAETSTILNIIEAMLNDIELAISPDNQDRQNRENIMLRLEEIIRQATYKGQKLFGGYYSSQLCFRGNYLKISEEISAPNQKPFKGTVPVIIHRFPVKANFTGICSLTRDVIATGAILTVKENGNKAEILTSAEQTAVQIICKLNELCKQNGINVTFALNGKLQITVTHNRFGAGEKFELFSSVNGLLNGRNGGFITVNNGRHIDGTIGNQKTICKNKELRCDAGSSYEGICLSAEEFPDDAENMTEFKAGDLEISINPLTFFPDGVYEYSYYPENLESFVGSAKKQVIVGDYEFDNFRTALRKKTGQIHLFTDAIRKIVMEKMTGVVKSNIGTQSSDAGVERLKNLIAQTENIADRTMIDQSIRQHLYL